MIQGQTQSQARIETLKAYAPLLIGATIGVGGGLLGAQLPPWAVRSLEQWGPAAALMLLIVWYVPRSAITDFITAQKDQAVALHSVAETMKSLPQKDHMKFEEILIGQQMLNNNLDRVHARLDEIMKS